MKNFIRSLFGENWLLLISVIYLIWPFDLISDVFGPVGLIDDGLLLLIAIVRAVYISRHK